MEMTTEKLKSFLALAMYFACFIVALSIFQIPKELNQSGAVPLRIIIMVAIALIIWALVAYFSTEAAWKSVAKEMGYTLALCLIVITAYGLRNFLGYISGNLTEISPSYSIALTVGGAISALAIGKGMKSKWLN